MIAALCLVFSMNGQTLGRNDALKLDADYYLMEKVFDKAQNIYLNILKSEPDNAAIKYRLGICYLNSPDEKAKAITYLEEAALKVSEKYNESSFKETNAPVDALFLLGSAYRINNQLDKATEAYTKYKQYLNPNDTYNLEVVDQYLKSCNVARNLETKPVNMTAENIGNKINTPVANFNAVISGDGKTMFYTATGKQGYDIYSSILSVEGWTAPKLMTGVLATGKFMKTCGISYDGTTLLLVLEDPVNSDIFFSHLEKGKWSKVDPLNKEIDSKSNETHASLSPDGKTLYFTSDRKGGLGDMDIYRSELNSKGEWGKPENLGPIINTRFNEETPFVSSDGSKLYFSSEGHESMGGYDVFRYDFNNPLDGVVNMGYPLNTTDNDLFYFPVDDGHSGYYSFKGAENYGGRDIYKITIQPAIEVSPVAVAAEVPIVAEAPMAAEAPVVAEPIIIPADTTPVVSETLVEKPTEQPVPEAVAAPVEISQPLSEEVPEKVEEPVMVKTEPIITETEVVKPEIAPKVSPSSQEGFNFYRIQLMALRKPVSFDYFAGISNMTITYNEDHWYRYSTWGACDYSKVRGDLQEMIGKGYRDAFIREERLGGAYTIQIMAVPGPVVDLSGFSNLSQVMVIKGLDNFCRYTTGTYATKEEALADLQRIRSMGYQKAFVTRLSFLTK